MLRCHKLSQDPSTQSYTTPTSKVHIRSDAETEPTAATELTTELRKRMQRKECKMLSSMFVQL